MNVPVSLTSLLLLLPPSIARPQTPQLSTSTSLVLVPTLVRSATGEPVPDLHAADFHITDNGVVQRVTLDDASPQPLAVVILLQTGGAAHDQLSAYAGLASLIDALTAPAPGSHTALITFDSQPEELWTFPPQLDGLAYALAHPTPGDTGAALLDGIAQALDLLAQQPPSFRRLILLVSQQVDGGSSTSAETILRRLAESNTTLEAITFSPEKAWLHDQFTRPRHGQPPYQMSPLGPAVLGTFDLGTPLGMALHALRGNPAATLATLSGGESLPFRNRATLEHQMTELANHIPTRYSLSISPANPTPGLHTLAVTLPHTAGSPTIFARATYWVPNPPSAAAHP